MNFKEVKGFYFGYCEAGHIENKLKQYFCTFEVGWLCGSENYRVD